MDDERIADYFIISGIADSSDSNIESKPLINSALPITDVAVIFKGLGEVCPVGYTCIENTPSGLTADLNHGNFKSQNIFICYKRGFEKPPLVELGVFYEGSERVLPGTEIIKHTPYDRNASLSGSKSGTYITYRRSKTKYPYNQLVVVELTVIFNDKSESPPPAFHVLKRNLNASVYGMIGSEVYLCYKKTLFSPPSLSFKPHIISRFPLTDYPNHPLPDEVPLFCLPTGANVERWPNNMKIPLPQSSNFVLTSDSAKKVYGSVLSFYEPFEDSILTEDQKTRLETDEKYSYDGEETQSQTYAIKSICILSRWPFFECFDKFLLFLHRLVFKDYLVKLSGSKNSSPVKDINRVSLEHYISHFLLEVRLPTLQRPKVLVQLVPGSDEEIQIMQPLRNLQLPLTGASFFLLLKTLGVENTMNVLVFGLSEQKILLHTLVPSLLTSVTEAITAMLFPFHWQCPYVPVCPLSLHGILNAPLPFIVGIDSRSFDKFSPPDDVICIDLDAKSILMSETKKCLNLKALPKRAARVLRNSLERIQVDIMKLQQTNNQSPQHHRSIDNSIQTTKRDIELRMREAFITFMATILRDFRHYLLPITKAPTVGATDPTSLFNFDGFLASRDRNYSQFYEWITKTQMFTHYIEERSFLSDKDSSLAFYDDCEEKLANCSGLFYDKSIQLFDDNDSLIEADRSVFIPAPERPSRSTSEISDTEKNYNKDESNIFPKFGPLDVEKFHRHPEQPDSKALIDFDQMTHLSDKSKLSAEVEDTTVYISKHTTIPNVSSGHMIVSTSRRTLQEVRQCQEQAKRAYESPSLWFKYLLSCSYGMWFAVLPSYINFCLQYHKTDDNLRQEASEETDNILKYAYSVIMKMRTLQMNIDEICFRVLTLLCGNHGQPALAVKVYFEMKKYGIIPSAVTYGYYNKAILESKWLKNDQSESGDEYDDGRMSDESESHSSLENSRSVITQGEIMEPTYDLSIKLNTCNKCDECHSHLYDEEIMEHWSYNESNLNSKCIYCQASMVPMIFVTIQDHRNLTYSDSSSLISEQALENTNKTKLIDVEEPDTSSQETLRTSQSQLNGKTNQNPITKSVTVPYLSPIVLWKELETVLDEFGDSCLTKSNFVDEHPIIYWNLLWFFKRIDQPSHLPILSLGAQSILDGRILSGIDFENINLKHLANRVIITICITTSFHKLVESKEEKNETQEYIDSEDSDI